jgi:hypothetical protein
VQSKFAASVILTTSPNGIMDVDAATDLLAQDARITFNCLRWYGQLLTLLKRIDNCIVLLDGPYPIGYMKAGGIVFDNYMGVSVDEFDLDHCMPPFSRYSEMYFDPQGRPLLESIPPLNSAVKWIVNNYCFIGYPSTFFAQHVPMIVVGEALAGLISSCPQNPTFMQHCVQAGDLDAALAFARRTAGTEEILCFDGAVGGFNLTPGLAALLRSGASAAAREVDTNLLPRWCAQRGLRMEERGLV